MKRDGSKKQKKVNRKFGGWLWAARVLLTVALATAGYLSWAGFQEGSIAGCGPASGCREVLSSRWGYWAGIPVSIMAVVIYAALIGLTFRLRAKPNTERARNHWAWASGLSLLIVLAGLWFTGLQLWAIERFCPFCITAHATAGAGALIVLLLAPAATSKQTKGGASKTGSKVRVSQWGQAIGIGAAATLLLILGQTLIRPPSYAVTRVSGQSESRSSEERILSLHDEHFELNVGELPMIGSPDAANLIVSLFDYTCRHCRVMHGHLKEAKEALGEKLGIVSLPVPLDADCNPIVDNTRSAHENACDYAKLGLALWRIDRQAFRKYDDWVFEPTNPPGVAEARQFAEKLVNESALEKALNGPWVEQRIAEDGQIYKANYEATGKGQMPQLIIGDKITAGEFSNVQGLYKVLQSEFGLNPSDAKQ